MEDTQMRGCILVIKSRGRTAVCGATMGAEGAGEKGFIIQGDPEAAQQYAVELARSMERAGHHIETAIVVRSDTESYSGHDLEVVRLESADANVLNLTPTELQLVLAHRAEREAKEAAGRFQRKVMQQAFAWLEYQDSTGDGLTFSTFVNSYGYQDPDGREVYEHVKNVLRAARPAV